MRNYYFFFTSRDTSNKWMSTCDLTLIHSGKLSVKLVQFLFHISETEMFTRVTCLSRLAKSQNQMNPNTETEWLQPKRSQWMDGCRQPYVFFLSLAQILQLDWSESWIQSFAWQWPRSGPSLASVCLCLICLCRSPHWCYCTASRLWPASLPSSQHACVTAPTCAGIRSFKELSNVQLLSLEKQVSSKKSCSFFIPNQQGFDSHVHFQFTQHASQITFWCVGFSLSLFCIFFPLSLADVCRFDVIMLKYDGCLMYGRTWWTSWASCSHFWLNACCDGAVLKLVCK